jgi:hypothetical protein
MKNGGTGVWEGQDNSRKTATRSELHASKHLDPMCMGTSDQPGIQGTQRRGRHRNPSHLKRTRIQHKFSPRLSSTLQSSIFSYRSGATTVMNQLQLASLLDSPGLVLPSQFKISEVRPKIKSCNFNTFSYPQRGLMTLHHKPCTVTSRYLQGLVSSELVFE